MAGIVQRRRKFGLFGARVASRAGSRYLRPEP